MNQVFDNTNHDKFLGDHQIGFGPFSHTSLTTHKETHEQFIQLLIPIQQNETIDKFKNVWDKLSKKQYPFSIRPSYAVLQIALYTPYAEKQSLKEIIQKLENGETIENFDSTQIFIIIYGILMYLKAIHQDNQYHGRLKISNVFLNSELSPLVSDAFLYDINENGPLNDSNNKMIDYIVSLPPKVIQNKDYTSKSDIYSLGIIILQILTHKINVYSDITDDCPKILQLKENEQLPNIPESQNQKLQDLIRKCLKSDPEKRPTADEMINVIEEIGCNGNNYDIQRLNKFLLLNHSTGERVTQRKVQKPISCREYPLSFSNDVFYLCAPKIQSNSELTFQINSTFRDNSSELTYQINYFEDNQAVIPNQIFEITDNNNSDNKDNQAVMTNQALKVSYNSHGNQLILIINEFYDVTRLHCVLEIKFSEALFVNVEIDSIIVPFVFGFDLYDYNMRKYVSDESTIYCSSQYLDREIVLHCRLYGIFFSEMKAFIKNGFGYPISIVSCPHDLVFHDESEFDIRIKLRCELPRFSESKFYYISAKIRNIEKKIKIHFINPGIFIDKSMNRFTTYGFDWKRKEWKELRSSSDDSLDIVYIVNPFYSLNKLDNTKSLIKVSVPLVKWNTISR